MEIAIPLGGEAYHPCSVDKIREFAREMINRPAPEGTNLVNAHPCKDRGDNFRKSDGKGNQAGIRQWVKEHCPEVPLKDTGIHIWGPCEVRD
jgi:hypothetical protein